MKCGLLIDVGDDDGGGGWGGFRGFEGKNNEIIIHQFIEYLEQSAHHWGEEKNRFAIFNIQPPAVKPAREEMVWRVSSFIYFISSIRLVINNREERWVHIESEKCASANQ